MRSRLGPARRSRFFFLPPCLQGSWTYEEFHQLVREHAVGLLESRYRPGDAMIVALDAAETTESVVTLLGAALADLRVEALDTTTLTGASLAKVARSRESRALTHSCTRRCALPTPGASRCRPARFPPSTRPCRSFARGRTDKTTVSLTIRTSRWPSRRTAFPHAACTPSSRPLFAIPCPIRSWQLRASNRPLLRCSCTAHTPTVTSSLPHSALLPLCSSMCRTACWSICRRTLRTGKSPHIVCVVD